MTTALGGRPQALRFMIKNGEGAAIRKGTAVTFNAYTVSFLDLANGKIDFVAGGGTAGDMPRIIPYVTMKDATLDTTTPGANQVIGIAEADIPTAGFGEIVTYGLVQVLCDAGTPAAGQVITCNVDGEAIDAANASHSNPFGIILETAVANTLKWAFVNCFCSFGDGGGTSFMGVAF